MQVEEHLRSVFGLRMGHNGKTVFGQAHPLRIQDTRVERAFAPDPPGAFLTPVEADAVAAARTNAIRSIKRTTLAHKTKFVLAELVFELVTQLFESRVAPTNDQGLRLHVHALRRIPPKCPCGRAVCFDLRLLGAIPR